MVADLLHRLWPFRPEPFLITPLNEEEARYGKPTLLTPGDAEVIREALTAHCPECQDLIKKVSDLVL